jgi:hypothetical protein
MPKRKKTHAEKDVLEANQQRTKYEKTEMLIGPEVTTKRAWEFFSTIPRNLMSVLVQQPHLLP